MSSVNDKLSRHAKIQELEALRGNAPVLGFMVTSDIATGQGADFAQVDLLIERHHLSATSRMEPIPGTTRFQMQRPTTEEVIHRALEDVRASIEHDRHGKVVQVPHRTDGLIIYVLKVRQSDEATGVHRDVNFVTKYKIVYDSQAAKDGNDPWGFPLGNEVILRPMIDKYLAQAQAWDVSRCVVLPAIDGCQPISLRARGGMYFVPIAFEDQLMRLRLFLGDWGAACQEPAHLTMLPLFDTAISRLDMQRKIAEQVRDEIEQRRKRLADLRQRVKTIKFETIESEMAATKDLRDQVMFYADLLDVQKDAILKAVEGMRDAFQALSEEVAGKPKTVKKAAPAN